MRRRTTIAIASVVLAATLSVLTSCGGRLDDGNPGNPSADTTTTETTVPVGVGG